MVEVSVLCTAYNQAQYIRKTLEGFVSQKTSFDYEVIIHDDASTDGTQDIINEYVSKYPNIIKAMMQSENQYSKGVDIYEEFLLPAVSGRYIAYCEGDDYWISSNKLQKQYDALENNNDCVICLHKVGIVKENGQSTTFSYPALRLKTGVNSNDTYFKYLCNDFFQLSSYFIPTILRKNYSKECMFRNKERVGDIPLLLWIGSLGKKFYYFDEELSKYRAYSKGSFNSRQQVSDSIIRNHHMAMIDMIHLFDSVTNYKYKQYCKQYENMEKFSAMLKTYDLRGILQSKDSRKRFMEFSLKKKAGFIFRMIKRRCKCIFG